MQLSYIQKCKNLPYRKPRSKEKFCGKDTLPPPSGTPSNLEGEFLEFFGRFLISGRFQHFRIDADNITAGC